MGQRIANKILLIGWDAADWQVIHPLLDEGLLPGLESLINRGVMGNLATLHPVLSPMLWNSIATGKTADKHGVLGFTEPNSTGTGIQPFSSRSRKVAALWNICHNQKLKSNVVGWWASHPAEPVHGCVVSNLVNGLKRGEQGELQVTPGTFHPAEKTAELASLKVHPDEIDAADILPFIPNAAEIDQSKDPRLSTLCKLLSDCATIQSVSTRLMETEPWDLTAVYFDAIDHFCHAFMYYHPPKMANVKDEDFVMYRDVINGIYRFHDMVLQRLLQLAGEETTIVLCSDHGFQSGGARPYSTPAEPAGPAAWHRDLGIIVMAGPGIKQDQRIYGANIIDITPTVLYQFGLPVGEDMDGRVLIDAFEAPEPPSYISSWESVDGDFGMHSESSEPECNDSQSEDLLQQFVALGYIEDPGEDRVRAAENCQLELDYNLARVFLSTNRFDSATKILTELVQKMPWEDRYWKNLAHCFFETGHYRQAQKIMEDLYRGIERPPIYSRVFLAKTCFELGEWDAANEYLDVAMALNPRQSVVYVMAGRILLKNSQLDRANAAFEKALEIDPDNAHAWLGCAEVELRLNRPEQAAEAALNALTILYRLEKAHWVLALAMIKMQNWNRAKDALTTLLKFQTTRYVVACHRLLARMYRQETDHRRADFHSLQAKHYLSLRRAEKKDRVSRCERIFELPAIPNVRERFQTHRKERPRPQSGKHQRTESGSSGRTLHIVSGLPRSGTSLMMQMLAAGGLAAKTDGERAADIDNPRGYLEWEAVRRLHKEPELLDDPDLDDLAIKVISMLLTNLPKEHRYKVIFMNRSVEEIAASQQKMIQRLGSGGGDPSFELTQKLHRHRQEAIEWLESRKFIDLLLVDYNEVVLHPTRESMRVAEFIGEDRIENIEAMVSVVDTRLYRNRQPNSHVQLPEA